MRLELQTTSQFDNFGGERNDLLNSFCKFQGGDIYVEDDADPDHWDLALLMSGVDMWAFTSPSSGTERTDPVFSI